MSEGKPSFLPGENFAVGWIDDPEYEEAHVRLRPGDRIYFYSDGVNEAMNERSEQLGNDRLFEMICAQAKSPVEEGVESMLAAVNAWCRPDSPNDDVSILVCQFQGEERASQTEEESD